MISSERPIAISTMLIRRRQTLKSQDRRQHKRIRSRPIKVTLDGKTYKTVDWSLSGIRLATFHRQLMVGERLEGRIGPIGTTDQGELIVAVVRTTEEGEVGFRILEVAPALFIAMSELSAG